MQDIKYPIRLKFWFSWIIVTALYVLFFLAKESNGAVDITYKVINLFTPFGFFNTVFSIGNPIGWVGIVLFLVALFKIDTVSSYLGISNTLSKILFNLLILFMFTCLIDFLLWRQLVSIMSFFGMSTPIQG